MAYRTLSKKYHPDKHNNDELYSRKMRDLNEAYEELSNTEKRNIYNSQLNKEKQRVGLIPRQQPAPQINPPKKVADVKKYKSSIIIAIFALIFVVLLVVGVSQISPNHKIFVGMTASQAKSTFGEPDEYTPTQMKYESSSLLIQNDVVIGWIDTYDKLNIIKFKNQPHISDVTQGMLIADILKKYGNPDSYSDKILAYGNLLIYPKNGIVEKSAMV